MNQQCSYRIETVAGNVEIEIGRLKAQVELFWDKELKHYIEFGLRDGVSIAELGSGPGFLTEKLLDNFPCSHVTALEIDPYLVDFAKGHLSENFGERCEVFEGSILETGLSENTYDFAIVRLLLEHLPSPVDAVREVFRILKPGGKALIVDNDFEMHIMTYPHVSNLRNLYDAYCRSRYAEGGNPKIGRELPAVLKKGGFSNIDFEIISAHSEIVGEKLFSKSEGVSIPFKLVKDGYLSGKTMGKVSVEWRNMLKNEGHSIIRQLYMAVGEKLI